MIDPFVLLAPILVLAVVALLRFTGCFIEPSPPAPTITGFDPPDATVGDGVSTPFELTVNGEWSLDGSFKVTFDGTDLKPTPGSVTGKAIKVTVPANLLATARDVAVTVTDGYGGTSGPQTFTVNNPQPQITGFNPPDATKGDLDFELTVNGSNFVTGLTVIFGNTPVSLNTPVTPSQIKVQIPATAPELASPGQVTVTVTNPDPSRGPGSLAFTVQDLISVVFPGPTPNDQPATGNTLIFDASWGWELGTTDDPIKHIFLAGGALSGTFTFATGHAPKLLKSMEVGSNSLLGHLVVTDDNPINIQPAQKLTIPAGSQGTSQLLTINWKLKSTTVTVTFDNPNSLSIHKISYQGPA